MPSYDPELDLIYMGTSVTAPAPKYLLAGNDREYLYHNSTLAISPDDGRIVWHYQHLVDHWDLDHPFERLLVDTRVSPDPASVAWINPAIDPDRVYRVLTGIPGKTGVVYTLDRETGETDVAEASDDGNAPRRAGFRPLRGRRIAFSRAPPVESLRA